MPQDRTLLQHSPQLKVERVLLHERGVQWSPSYQVATQRLVLPASGATEFRIAGQHILLDGLTALCLPTGVPYQMKPCADATRTSIVVSAQPGMSHTLPPPDAWLLTPRVLWRLRLHWRALARGAAGARLGDSTQALLQAVLPLAGPAPRSEGRSAAAVQRARRFMVERTAAMGATRWTLDDVADAACASPFHLARCFRQHTGLSLHGYRQRLRLTTALQRLEEGERDLAALAHDLGYSSQSHFGAAFVRELGITPAQARRELTA
ncbi:MAG: helix-turn-helix transcriptional regulator [Polaromonas sp.]|uniref:helix-turn-helix transcriptional regulator n=1 Tax=Polaromonas sp. TaxID=1869339 RepID=UPI0024899226|nr:helix-turn-helix transcriptional regulator [Polaromonas sp.]MDI1239258.1 helix-turn-helix transcriptional regulator [Polaromonas sp.]MDI1342299.1 helix-turn-helix transcriptional regulator [Polaromonas sp.]